MAGTKLHVMLALMYGTAAANLGEEDCLLPPVPADMYTRSHTVRQSAFES